MKTFIGDNFLLDNEYSEELYHDFASVMPIIDYHNHLPPEDIAIDKSYKNLTQLWIEGDHYKWRAMRTLGVKEKYITGAASDQDKFAQWAYAVPYTLRNPLYHWTHLELQRYFGITTLLSPDTADSIYKEVNEQLKTPAFSCRHLLSQMSVDYLCTTEDPTDKLAHHSSIMQQPFGTQVSTAFRPDNALLIETDTYIDYINSLSECSDINIISYDSLCEAMRKRIQYFHEHGCRISDHGLPHMYAADYSASQVSAIFEKKLNGRKITETEALQFKSALLFFLSEQYHEHGWIQQFHLGPMRNNSTRKYHSLGANTGWDSIGDWPQAEDLARFLDRLDMNDKLCKTIIYNLNPKDNEVFASMTGNFNDGTIKGKVQFGSGWWFLDQKDGMTKQLNALSNIGLLSCFIGMLTDSRSFLSFPRHEYFRRVLCNLFGTEIANGELPNDMKWTGKIIQDICYNNAKEYFNL